MTLNAHQERVIASFAAVDPRTVRRYLAGEPVRSTCRTHIERALAALGLTEVLPPGPVR